MKHKNTAAKIAYFFTSEFENVFENSEVKKKI